MTDEFGCIHAGPRYIAESPVASAAFAFCRGLYYFLVAVDIYSSPGTVGGLLNDYTSIRVTMCGRWGRGRWRRRFRMARTKPRTKVSSLFGGYGFRVQDTTIFIRVFRLEPARRQECGSAARRHLLAPRLAVTARTAAFNGNCICGTTAICVCTNPAGSAGTASTDFAQTAGAAQAPPSLTFPWLRHHRQRTTMICTPSCLTRRRDGSERE